jgi:methyl-accepting chemotaxis protein
MIPTHAANLEGIRVNNNKLIRFIRNLSLRGKFLFVTIVMLVPLSVLTITAARLEIDKMNFARGENAGLKWAAELVTIAANLSEYREHHMAVAFGADHEREEMEEHAGLVREAAARLDALAASGDADLLEASDWTTLRPRVSAAIEDDGGSDDIRALGVELHDKIMSVAEVSGLILDPSADSFALMFSGLFDLPRGIEALASARRAMDALVAGDDDVATHMALAAQSADAGIRLRSGMHFLAEFFAANAAEDSQIPALAKPLAARVESALKVLETEARRGLGAERAKVVSEEMELLTEDLSAMRMLVNGELSRLLDDRARHSQWILAIEALLVSFGLALAYWLQSRVTAHISQHLETANEAFAKLARGEFDSPLAADSADELGALLSRLSSMQSQLAARVDSDRRAAAEERVRAVATERIKQALDASSVNVVVCDEQHQVIYLNPAAQRLMTATQADFRRVQPRFDADRLVGSSLDVFFQDGAGQRDAIASARHAITQQFTVGARTLVSTASPIVDGAGVRIGSVIEWLDRTQEVAAEKEIGDLVVAVSDGKLDQRISLEGKQGFFQVLATGLNGVVITVSDVVAELRRLVEGANDGDLTRSIRMEGRSGLYVSMGTGVNALVSNMAGVVAQVKDMAAQVHTGAEEISRGNTNLSQRTEEQAASLEETASSMEEMTSTVKQTADNAGQANQLALAARQQAEKGGAVVNSAVTAMNGINEASRKIADIIGVIDEIAFQTNLLALNAAVEAARAGEQGRGFAVVATEVRSLAGRSATAAKEIKALIQDSVSKVEQGSRLVDESGRMLEEIVGAVKKVTDIVAEIAAASREQSSGIEQVNKAVMQMDANTQQNAGLVEQAAAASQAIVEQALLLHSLVAHYQVNDAAARPAPVAAVERRRSAGAGR